VRRWTTSIRTIDDAMDKVRQLRGVSFDWRRSGTPDIGMIAEEVGRARTAGPDVPTQP